MRRKHSDTHLSQSAVLQRQSKVRIGHSLLIRAAIVIGLLGIALIGNWIHRDGIKDTHDGVMSFMDVLYFTAVTTTTVGYGDVVPVSDSARFFDTVVVTPIRIFIWLIFLGSAYTFLLQHTWEKARSKMIQKELTGHTIVAGFGAGGEFAVEELLSSGRDPSQIVVIEMDRARVQAALTHKVIAIEGDATSNKVLEAARIETADALLVSTSRDDAAALIVLSARHLNAQIPISVTVRARDNEDLMYQAGADFVINPIGLGGQILARSSDSKAAVEYLKDLTTAGGTVIMRQRQVTSDEIGAPLHSIKTGFGMQIVRDGRTIGFWETDRTTLQHGDIVVEIQPTEASPN